MTPTFVPVGSVTTKSPNAAKNACASFLSRKSAGSSRSSSARAIRLPVGEGAILFFVQFPRYGVGRLESDDYETVTWTFVE
jgi:hypothetical protein